MNFIENNVPIHITLFVWSSYRKIKSFTSQHFLQLLANPTAELGRFKVEVLLFEITVPFGSILK